MRGSAPETRWRRPSARARRSITSSAGPARRRPATGASIAWKASDTFCLPGGTATRHRAAEDAVLWITTNEPQLQFEALRPPAPGAAPIQPALYPMAEIRRRLLEVYLDPRGAAMPGKSVNLGKRRDGGEPHHDPVVHARAELAPARRGAARPPPQRGRGDPGAGRRALLLADRRGARGLGASHGDDHAARRVPLSPQRREPSWRSSSSSRTGASTTTAGRWGSATSSPSPRQSRRKSGNQRVRVDGSTRMVSSRPGPVDTSEISHSIRSSIHRR